MPNPVSPNHQPAATPAAAPAQTPQPTAPIQLKPPEVLFDTQDSAQVRPPASGTAAQSVPLVDEVSYAEVQWASQLEANASQGQAVSPENEAKYWNIIERLAASELSEQDLAWAGEMENLSAQGKTDFTPEQQQRYQIIASKVGARRLMANRQPTQSPQPAPAAPPAQEAQPSAPVQSPQASAPVQSPQAPTASGQRVSMEEIQWATQIEQGRVAGQAVSEADDAKYWNILERLAAEEITPEDEAWKAEIEALANNGQTEFSAEVQQRYQRLASQYGARMLLEQRAQAAAQPASPAQTGSAEDVLANTASDAVAAPPTPEAQNPVDAQMIAEKFGQLDELLGQKKYIWVGDPVQPEAIRATSVQIWLDGSPEDRLNLSQKLVEAGQSDVLARILNHNETAPLEVARLMTEGDFPLKEFMGDLDDNRAFLVLNAMAEVALTGESSSAMVLQEVAQSYDSQYGGFWDREQPFKQLKNHLQIQGNWDKLPLIVRNKIDEVLD